MKWKTFSCCCKRCTSVGACIQLYHPSPSITFPPQKRTHIYSLQMQALMDNLVVLFVISHTNAPYKTLLPYCCRCSGCFVFSVVVAVACALHNASGQALLLFNAATLFRPPNQCNVNVSYLFLCLVVTPYGVGSPGVRYTLREVLIPRSYAHNCV